MSLSRTGLLLAALVAFAYRGLLLGLAQGTPVADAVDLERWFFLPTETAPLLVYALAAWLAHRRRDRWRALAWNERSVALAVALLAIGFAAYAWSLHTGATDLLLVSLAANAIGAAAWCGGMAAVRVVWLPALFLLFALPIPAPLLAEMLWNFQLWTAQYAGWLLFLIGQTVYVAGDQIWLPDHAFQVIETCSGLRSVQTLTMLAVIAIDLFGRRGWHAALLFLAAPLLAFALNGLRVLTLVLNPSSDIAAIHDLQGLAVLIAGLLVLVAIDSGLARMLDSDDAEATASDPPPSADRQTSPAREGVWRAPAIGAVALAVLGFVVPLHDVGSIAQPPLTQFLPQRMGDWQAIDELQLDREFIGNFGLRQRVHRRYRSPDGETVDLLVAAAHHDDRLRSLFSPKSGVPGSGWVLLEEEPIPASTDLSREHETVYRRGPERRLVRHAYRHTSGTGSETLRTFLALDASPLRRPQDAVLVRLVTDLSDSREDGRAAARRRLADFKAQVVAGLHSWEEALRTLRSAGTVGDEDAGEAGRFSRLAQPGSHPRVEQDERSFAQAFAP